MFKISKRMEVAGAHQLNLNYESACSNVHGHNWIITVHCKTKQLDENGMVIDFKHIKNAVHNRLDHKLINEVVPFNPTAENIARWIQENVTNCYKVEVQESEGNIAIYEVDDEN